MRTPAEATSFQDERLEPAPSEVGRADEAVVAPSDDDRVEIVSHVSTHSNQRAQRDRRPHAQSFGGV